ncbi:MAG: hypothetical protein US49_C0001G0186 [candidate division TM6 bacterium GW2011_GWF2_37_49]|nr:MAG: hypothetical protein US49_C0001G0186 [candidate division TM6 bacterium GW2011_GWF2_37_49]
MSRGLNEILDKATNSHNLAERIKKNTQGTEDIFSSWTDSLFVSLNYSNVLDICCGTGNQIVKYATNKKVKNITGIDISEGSLNFSLSRLSELNSTAMIDLKNISMDLFFEKRHQKYDLISCFYGLYYSKNIKKLISQMINCTEDGGVILIVGPYGENNASFFGLIEEHYKIPDLVKKSATSFMGDDVLPELSMQTRVQMKTLVNKIYFYSSDELVNYWRATTFYNFTHEKAVRLDIDSYFVKHDFFIIEKHIIAFIATKI